ncbi:MAG: phytanoyl-CoA dioxygenase [Flaviaesturariibacter sp.]|nr:phytanoyl-CoA dioxygenase [Flaviaesturariibacter sp.]
MDSNNKAVEQIARNGFAIISDIYSSSETESIIEAIDNVDSPNLTFRRSADLFAIRQFLKEVPEVQPLIFT